MANKANATIKEYETAVMQHSETIWDDMSAGMRRYFLNINRTAIYVGFQGGIEHDRLAEILLGKHVI